MSSAGQYLDMAALEPDEVDWWLLTQAISGEIATSVALEAIDGALHRLEGFGRQEIREAFPAIAEATWWVAALDEQLGKRLAQTGSTFRDRYRAARDTDPEGQYVLGFLWARNGHTHQLPFTTEHDDTPAFGQPDAVLYISKGLIWKPSADYAMPDPGFRTNTQWLAAYDRLMAGESLTGTLSHCSEWFHRVAGHRDDWRRFPTVAALTL